MHYFRLGSLPHEGSSRETCLAQLPVAHQLKLSHVFGSTVALPKLYIAPRQLAFSSDEESNCANAGSDKEPDRQVKMSCRAGMGGEELGAVMLDRDLTVGQLKSKVLRLLKVTDERIDMCWFRAKVFLMEGFMEYFSFEEDYTRFMQTKVVRETLTCKKRNKPFEIECTIIAQRRGC